MPKPATREHADFVAEVPNAFGATFGNTPITDITESDDPPLRGYHLWPLPKLIAAAKGDPVTNELRLAVHDHILRLNHAPLCFTSGAKESAYEKMARYYTATNRPELIVSPVEFEKQQAERAALCKQLLAAEVRWR